MFLFDPQPSGQPLAHRQTSDLFRVRICRNSCKRNPAKPKRLMSAFDHQLVSTLGSTNLDLNVISTKIQLLPHETQNRLMLDRQSA